MKSPKQSKSEEMDSSPSDQATLFESRSASFTTTSDLARRLRSLLTPPRTRRSPDCTSSSARSSPTHLSRATIATSAPATRKTVMGWDVPAKKSLKQCRSCDDVGRLEHIFEPRMAPYTPPNNVFSKPNSEDASPIEQQRLEKLEFTLFEPRNAPCTPPLVRRVANSDGLSSSHSDLTVRPASVTDEPTQQQPISGEFSSESLSCTKLCQAISVILHDKSLQVHRYGCVSLLTSMSIQL